MTFLNPPSFQTGDVLSASKVNHLLTDIDMLYGWFFGPNYGVDQLIYSTSQLWENVEAWAGWCVFTGDTLVVKLASFEGTGVVANVYFDDVQVGNPAGYSTAGTYTIPLPVAAHGWQQWTAYRIKIIAHRPQNTGGFLVLQVFLKDSTPPSSGSLPSFADEDTSSAADFNAIANGIRNVEPLVVQPVVGCRGGEEYTVQATNTGWTTVASWAVQHRVNALRCSLFLQGPWQTGTISARLRHNGTVVNGAEWSVGAFQSRRITDQIFTIPGSPTVGTFYTVDLQVKQSTGWLTGWYVSPSYVYEDQLGLPASYYETLRWEHGDYAVGDTDNPGLFVLSRNLSAIDSNSASCGAVNIVQREPISTAASPVFINYNRRFYHVRRWRWLAYNQHSWQPEYPDVDVPAATVNWTYDGITWDSYTLPDVSGGGFYDLDSSPIAQGMVFYATGCQYAIQSPYTY